MRLVGDEGGHQGGAKQVLDMLVARRRRPAAIVEAEGLGAVGGADELAADRRAALEANPDVAEKLAAAT